LERLGQLFFHASGVAAFLQAFLVAIRSSPQPEAQARAPSEVERVLGVLDHGLQHRQFVAGDTYSNADIAHFGWLWRQQAIGANLDKFSSHQSPAGTPKSRCGPPSLPPSLRPWRSLSRATLPSSPRTVGHEHARLFRVG
jgi:glutathione S-transferase